MPKAWRVTEHNKRNAARALKKEESMRHMTANGLVKVRPGWRQRANDKKRAARKLLSELVPTEAQLKAKAAYNKYYRDKYHSKTPEQRRRKISVEKSIFIKLQRHNLMLRKCVLAMETAEEVQQAEANINYLKENKSLGILLSTSETKMIEYLAGPRCNYNRTVAEEMDPTERIGLFLQLHRVNDIFDAQLKIDKQQWNGQNHAAYIIEHFHAITQSFSEGAINGALELFFKKQLRNAESGACSTLSLTVALNSQAYRSCNNTGLQCISDSVNRFEASGEGIFPSRNAIQHSGLEIATGTKAIVIPTIDADYRVYRVDPVTELKNITSVDFIGREQQLTRELVNTHLLDTQISDSAWKACIVRVNTNNAALMAEIKEKAIDINYSCDGFELASSFNGGVGFILSFKGPEVLCRLNKHYNTQKDDPTFGNRAGLLIF